MSMPAAGDGRVWMAYPDSRGDRQHHLGCFDLRGLRLASDGRLFEDLAAYDCPDLQRIDRLTDKTS